MAGKAKGPKQAMSEGTHIGGKGQNKGAHKAPFSGGAKTPTPHGTSAAAKAANKNMGGKGKMKAC